MARLNHKKCCWEIGCKKRFLFGCKKPRKHFCFESVKDAKRKGKDFDKTVHALDSLPKPQKQKMWEDFVKENKS